MKPPAKRQRGNPHCRLNVPLLLVLLRRIANAELPAPAMPELLEAASDHGMPTSRATAVRPLADAEYHLAICIRWQREGHNPRRGHYRVTDFGLLDPTKL